MPDLIFDVLICFILCNFIYFFILVPSYLIACFVRLINFLTGEWLLNIICGTNGWSRVRKGSIYIDLLLGVRRMNRELTRLVTVLWLLSRTPPLCPRPKAEGVAVGAEEGEEGEGLVCFGPVGCTRGTSTALSTTVSLSGWGNIWNRSYTHCCHPFSFSWTF